MAILRDFMHLFEAKARRTDKGVEFLDYLFRDIDPEEWEVRITYPLEQEADFINFIRDEIEVFYSGEKGITPEGTIMLSVVRKICSDLKLTKSKIM
jgi:hypothetical protein